LPSNLLITRRWRDRITPVYAQPTQENFELAKLLIQTYKDHLGKRKDELNEATGGLEELGHDYRYVRGLSTLLDRRCQLELKSFTDPVEVRRVTFRMANEKGLPINQERRQVILLQAARELGLAIEELEDSLYGDLEGELILRGFESPDPEALVNQYNLSLTQTLLFFSTELNFTTQGNWQQIFRQIKWLGLIYDIQRIGDGYEVKVDGPISLFKLNRRYGTNLAKLLPSIVQTRSWSIKAKILPRRSERRLLNLELNSEKHGGYVGTFHVPKEVYDSSVEQDFADRFKALSTGWILVRESEPIPVGKQVMIPDFSFQKDGLKVYMEIAGFWTPQYLREKMKKLSQLKDIDMIVAADKNLACQKLERIGERMNLIYYKRRIPLRPILTHLKSREEQLVKDQTSRLKVEDFEIRKLVVEVRDLAKELRVQEDALTEVLKEREIPGYVNLGELLIKRTKLEEIHKILENRFEQGELNLREALEIIEDTGGKGSTRILDALGYKVVWQGIDAKSAKILRKNKS
jgi:predicted nuclease of restriction endonuclease-like RecB superfamily